MLLSVHHPNRLSTSVHLCLHPIPDSPRRILRLSIMAVHLSTPPVPSLLYHHTSGLHYNCRVHNHVSSWYSFPPATLACHLPQPRPQASSSMPRASTLVSNFDHALVEKYTFNVHCPNPPSTSASRGLKDTWRTIIACGLTSGPGHVQRLTPNVRRLIAVFVLVNTCLGTSLNHTQYRPRRVLE